MFLRSLRDTLILLVASTAAVLAAPSLSVKVTGPEVVTDVNSLKVNAIMTNIGDEVLRILNDPYSPLSKLTADTFLVTNAKGATLAFTGVKAKYLPSAANAMGKDAITVLAPGQSVEVKHNLSAVYNFSESGAGGYSVQPNKKFYIINSEGELVPLYAETRAYTTKLSVPLTASVPGRAEVKRGFTGCSDIQEATLQLAAVEAEYYARNAASAADSPRPGRRFTTWFGKVTTERHDIVGENFRFMSEASFSTFGFDCTCTDPNAYAYVHPEQRGIVYICPLFWRAPLIGTNSKAGILIHQASRFPQYGATRNIVNGQRACKWLARLKPDQTVENADSYQYFAENNPPLL